MGHSAAPPAAAPVPGAAGASLPCDSRGGPLLPRRAVPRRPQPCVSLPARDTITREAGRVLEGVGGGWGEKRTETALRLLQVSAVEGGCRCPRPREGDRGCSGGSCGRGGGGEGAGRSPLPSARGAVPAGGGDGGGHEQHAAESDRAGAHGRGPADRRAAAVSGAVPLPGLCCGTGVPAGGGRGGSEDAPPGSRAPAPLPARTRLLAARSPRTAAMSRQMRGSPRGERGCAAPKLLTATQPDSVNF